MNLRAVCAVLMMMTMCVAPRPASAQSPAEDGRFTVDQLGWIAGAWTGTLGDRTIEQHWSAPKAGSLVAMYRSIRDCRPTLYELLAIEQDGAAVVLRIKHFAPGPGLVSQEAKDQSIDHRLVRLEDRLAVFEGTAPGTPVRITFTSPDPSTLTIVVHRTREGKPVTTEFKYRRITS